LTPWRNGSASDSRFFFLHIFSLKSKLLP
jgi:hypothetical protein